MKTARYKTETPNQTHSLKVPIIKKKKKTLLFIHIIWFLFLGGAFVSVQDKASPFGYKRGEGIDAGKGETGWVVARERQKYDSIFTSLEKSDGKLSGASMFSPIIALINVYKYSEQYYIITRIFIVAKAEMVKSKLPNSVLGKIWKLADTDGDGFLDMDEFALAMHLIQVKLEGHELPVELPDHLVPPSKRDI